MKNRQERIQIAINSLDFIPGDKVWVKGIKEKRVEATIDSIEMTSHSVQYTVSFFDGCNLHVWAMTEDHLELIDEEAERTPVYYL